MLPGIVSGFSRPVVGGDPNTIALLHFDGADGSTTITDEKGTLAWTAANGAALSTSVTNFSQTVRFPSSTARVTLSAPGYALGNGDFTLEAFIRWTSRSGNNAVFGWGANWAVYTFSNQWAVFDGVASNVIGPVGTVSNTTWYHVALSRASGTLRLFVAGALLRSVANSTNHVGANLAIGNFQAGNGNAGSSNIDEFRLSNIARYTSAFTPPAAPFTP